MSNERQETVADIVAEMRIGDLCAADTSARQMYINDFLASYADRIEAAHKREVAELRECLVRRSSHLNAILQKALELRNGVPPELRKAMDECIIAEDKAIGFGVFSKKGAEDEVSTK